MKYDDASRSISLVECIRRTDMSKEIVALNMTPEVKEVVYQIQDHIDQMDHIDDGPDGKYANSTFLPMLKEQRRELEHNTLVYLMELFKMVEAVVEADDAE